MNLDNMRERMWTFLGLFEDGQKPNYLRQEIDDNLNQALIDIYMRTHFWWHFLDEVDLDLTAGTADYELDSYCLMPVAIKLQGNDEDFVPFISPMEADRQGLRQTSLVQGSAGPFQWTWKPSRRVAEKTADIDVEDDDATVTINSINVAIDETVDVGKRVRINGEQADYTIASIAVGAATLELDRPYRSPRTGRETDDSGEDRSGVTMEINPPPAWKVTLTPVPDQDMTVTVRMARRPRWLLHGTDVPELEESAHQVLELGAKRNLCRFTEDSKNWQLYNQEFEVALKRLRDRNWPVAAPGRVFWRSDLLTGRGGPQARYNDVYRRVR